MKISQFKMFVTPEQSKIVQEFLFAQGYSWKDGTTKVKNLNKKLLLFTDTYEAGLGLTYTNTFTFVTYTHIPELTFEEFENKYIKVEDTSKALRYNKGKCRWSLVHFKSLEPLVRVMEYGASKYEVNNWMKPMNTNEILESLTRHLFALLDGQELDEESQQPHIGHIMANAMMYHYHRTKDHGTN